MSNLTLTPGSARKRRPIQGLPITALTQKPRNHENEIRLRALKTGSLKIHGVDYETNVQDLEYLSELGNGTSGHVVKMRHKPSGAIIAVKVIKFSIISLFCIITFHFHLHTLILLIKNAANAKDWK